MTFGEYLKLKRTEKGITLRKFSQMVGIAPSYMSDIEKSKRNAPGEDILNKIIYILELTDDEKSEFLDLAASSKDIIACDIKEYISDNSNVRVALRKAKDLNIGNDEWIKIIEDIINRKE